MNNYIYYYLARMVGYQRLPVNRSREKKKNITRTTMTAAVVSPTAQQVAVEESCSFRADTLNVKDYVVVVVVVHYVSLLCYKQSFFVDRYYILINSKFQFSSSYFQGLPMSQEKKGFPRLPGCSTVTDLKKVYEVWPRSFHETKTRDLTAPVGRMPVRSSPHLQTIFV